MSIATERQTSVTVAVGEESITFETGKLAKQADGAVYNFPPYSVGETGFMRGPKRREIGHGALAQRALEPIIPTRSTSRTRSVSSPEASRVQRFVVDGTVCGSTLSLMDAGVPIKAPVAGSPWGLSRRATTT